MARVRFASGLRLIYKPRAVTGEQLWSRAVAWLFRGTGVGPARTPAILARAGHGWIEALRPDPPRSAAASRRYHRKAGMLLALFDVLEVRDVHRGNLLPVGDDPILVDAETIAHPRFGRFRRSPSLALTGFLPHPGADAGRAGLGPGVRAPGRAGDYADELIDGYRVAFRRLREAGAELLEPAGPLRGLADLRGRVVLRPTGVYGAALQTPGAPWRDPPALPLPRRGWRAVESRERAALARGDVPLFHCRGGSTDLLEEDEVVVGSCFARSALATIAERLDRLSPREENRLAGLLRAILAVERLRAVPGTAG